MKKLNLKKKVVSVLTNEEKQFIEGGEGTTSYSDCTGFLCCSPEGCGDPTVLTTGGPTTQTIVVTAYC